MKVAVCDDNELEQRRLKLFLQRLEKEEQLAMDISLFDNADSVIEAFRAGADWDILFLDIYMEGISGISAAKTLCDEGFGGSIVFCTASVEHAVESYKLKADGYIVKPYNYEEFVDSIWRCRRQFDSSKKSLNFRAERLEFSLPLADVFYIETTSRSCTVHSKDKEYTTYKKIGEFEEELNDETAFLRLGRSFLVNLNNAESCTADVLIMANGEELPLPCRENKKYRQLITDYLQREKK